MSELHETDPAADPFEQFARWYAEATAASRSDPSAMTLATVRPNGRPSARMVLLKSFDPNGFVFYTNYASQKGNELATHPYAALVLHWPELHRQVRIEGPVERASDEESDRYFASRARGSQISAAVSPQSQVVSSREELESRVAAAEARYAGRTVARPTEWGGYRVVPETIEFWQGRANRLHDRLRFRREAEAWTVERLAP